MIVLLLILVTIALLVLLGRAIRALLHENHVDPDVVRPGPRRRILRDEDLTTDSELPAEAPQP